MKMKIVNKNTFLQMPNNTVYSKYKPYIFGELCIKGKTVENDFYYQEISSAQLCDYGTYFDALFFAERDEISFTFDFNCEGRDAMLDEHQLFAVWEQADVLALIARLQQTIKI